MARHGHSIDGQRFAFEAHLSDALSLGAYVRIDTVGGRSYLGQVLHETVVPTAGSERQLASRHIEGGGVLLSRLADDQSVAVESSDVFGDGTVDEADDEVVRAYLDSITAQGPRLRLGTIAALSACRRIW